MDLVRGLTSFLTIWIACNTTGAQEKGIQNDQSPQVKIQLSVGKPSKPVPKIPFDLNTHLQSEPKEKPSAQSETASFPKFLEDQTVSSVIFNEIQSLVLTKSSFKIISYISFKPHLKTLSHIKDLLQKVLNKTESFLQLKSFPPYHSRLTSEAKFTQNLKDKSIKIQLTELTYEINLVVRNFDLIKDRFYQITGQHQDSNSANANIDSQPEPTVARESFRSKRSIASSVFKFLFGGNDNSEAIKMLKQNVETLMVNDELQESRLKDILKSQQLNSADIKINRDLLHQMTKELAQVNVTLTEMTFNTEILFTLANFQVSISQLRHRVNIIRDALFGLQMNLDILYHHFSAMVDNKLTPEMISPVHLLTILKEVKEDIRDHPRLSLPEELTDLSIYKYYKMIKFEVTMEQEMMLGIMKIPLVEINKEF